MGYIIVLTRWIHVLAGAAWLGEVVVINFVLLPALFELAPAERGRFLKQVFPRVFRLASHLALTTLVTGAVLTVLRTQGQLTLLVTTRWGWAIVAGGIVGLLLALFHFFMEGRMEQPVSAAESDPHGQEVQRVYRRLRLVPRAGLAVILFIFIAMMTASHGWPW